jgi:hypothetical protein
MRVATVLSSVSPGLSPSGFTALLSAYLNFSMTRGLLENITLTGPI